MFLQAEIKAKEKTICLNDISIVNIADDLWILEWFLLLLKR